MSARINRFVDSELFCENTLRVLARILKMRDQFLNDLASGDINSYETYKYALGNLNGVDHCLKEFEFLINRAGVPHGN